MDFGLACHQTSHSDPSFLGSSEPRDEKGHGSGHPKHQRSELADDNDGNIWSLSKLPRPNEVNFSSKKADETLISTPFRRSILWSTADDVDGQKMLSFSSDEPHSGGGSSRSIAFSIYQDEHRSRAEGLGRIGGSYGPLAGMRGPFSPSQWLELEHQALIYKHIVENVPVPSNLLVPLKRSPYSCGSLSSYSPTLLGWGPFHLGFSGSHDPEPGRCRRTDGKKWRCSRDAVPEQKYCERHINRGRHRSRKPVEGHIGHAQTTAAAKVVVPPPLPAPSSSMKQPKFACASTDYLVGRSQEFEALSLLPLKTKDTPFSLQKQHLTFQDPPDSEFGAVLSNSLLNPSGRDSNLHHFMDLRNEPLKPDWTQLSMSIPMAAPTLAKPSSLVGQAHELSPIVHMNLGPGDKEQQPAASWPLGGPLGEVLSSQVSGSSPTGVLPKLTFVSLSNSSSGSMSSSRTSGDHNKGSTDNGNLCSDVFGLSLLSSGAFQSM